MHDQAPQALLLEFRRHHVVDHLGLVPFGCADGREPGLAVDGFELASLWVRCPVPLAIIDRRREVPLTCGELFDLLPSWPCPLLDPGPGRRFARVFEELDGLCGPGAPLATRFLARYRDHCLGAVAPGGGEDEAFRAPLPLPRAYLSCQAPYRGSWNFEPWRVVGVDFCFWTGRRLVAVILKDDGRSRPMLEGAGVTVVALGPDELLAADPAALRRLPPEVLRFPDHPWPGETKNPFGPPF